jgi:LPXTG-site transpeptidase (sortase) family protein
MALAPADRPPEPAPEHPHRRAGDNDRGDPAHDPGAACGAGVDPGLLVGATDDEVLRSYLDLVRTWRGAGRRDAIRLRRADVAVLVSILGTDDAEIERRLVRATACTPKAARHGRLLLLASVAALSLPLTAPPVAAAPPPAHLAPPYAPAPPVAAAPADTAIAAGARPPVTAPATAPAVTVTEPTGAETPPATAAMPTTAGSSGPAGTGASVSIPSLGIDLPVVDGGQEVIDRGVAAHYVAEGWEPPVAAGAAGTYWLAAHHVSHGGPFADLPGIAVGAAIRVTAGHRTFVYTVTAKEVVGLLPGDAAVYGTDPTAAVILVQTCLDDTRRVLVHGTLTATE